MSGPRTPKWLWLIAALAVIAGLLALWRFTPLGEWTDPERIAEQLSALARSPWAPLSLGLLYLVAAPLMFPIIALNLAMILALGPALGVAYAMYGTLLSGLAAFLVGRRFGPKPLQGLNSDALNKALKVIRSSGLPGMVMLRMVPVAPYPVVNLMLGAGGVSVWIFLIGTVCGVLPFLIAIGLLGFQLREVVQEPDAMSVGILIGTLLAFVMLTWWIKHRLSARLADT